MTGRHDFVETARALVALGVVIVGLVMIGAVALVTGWKQFGLAGLALGAGVALGVVTGLALGHALHAVAARACPDLARARRWAVEEQRRRAAGQPTRSRPDEVGGAPIVVLQFGPPLLWGLALTILHSGHASVLIGFALAIGMSMVGMDRYEPGSAWMGWLVIARIAPPVAVALARLEEAVGLPGPPDGPLRGLTRSGWARRWPSVRRYVIERDAPAALLDLCRRGAGPDLPAAFRRLVALAPYRARTLLEQTGPRWQARLPAGALTPLLVHDDRTVREVAMRAAARAHRETD